MRKVSDWKEDRSLLIYPPARPGSSYVIPEGIQVIDRDAFVGCAMLSSITIPGSVTAISENTFAQCSPDLILTVERNSYARQYAIDHGIPFTYPDALDWLHN